MEKKPRTKTRIPKGNMRFSFRSVSPSGAMAGMSAVMDERRILVMYRVALMENSEFEKLSALEPFADIFAPKQKLRVVK